jgi:tRNA-(MS[2]IO[6]A)-hydroxylase (MiaE)-like
MVAGGSVDTLQNMTEQPSAASGTLPADQPDLAADPGYQAAVIDLLGVLAYGELTGFSRMGTDSDLAPTLTAKAELARLAVVRFGHFERVRDRLLRLGVDPESAMEPYVAAVDAFHERTAPSTWLEGLVKAYVGEGISFDFYREISAYVDPETRDLVTVVLADEGQGEFVVREVRGAIEADPRVAGRLALWGRRLVGEALSQAQRVAADRDALTWLLVGSVTRPGADLAELMRMFGRLTEAHIRRMGELGLSA